jgi:hypothetical protein
MNTGFIKQSVARLTEATLSVLIALVFFLAFLALLYLLFPSGTTFSDMVRDADRRFLPGEDALGRSLLVSDGQHAYEGFQDGANAAFLAVVRNKVKSKAATEIAWTKAAEGMRLYDRHAVQTFDRSSAVIKFDDRNQLNVGDNSLVVIKRLERNPVFRERRSFLVVVDGELRGTIAASTESALFFEIETPGAVTRIRTRDIKEGKVDFRISVDPEDKSSFIAMLRGSAEVEAGGQSVVVGSNTSTVVTPGGMPSEPQALPEPVMLHTPADDAVLYYRDLPPRISFSWQPVPAASGYIFMLGRDPLLSDIVIEERLSRPSFLHGNLKGGTYYWRVSAPRSGQQSLSSETRRITLLQDGIPPLLTVEFPPPTVEGDEGVVRGAVESGCRVYVMGKPAATDRSGRFSHRITLRHGINIIVVEAVDAAGNTTYRSQLVNGKF